MHQICGKNIHHTPHVGGDRAPVGAVSTHGGLEALCKAELSACSEIIRIWMRLSRPVSGLCASCHCLGRTDGQCAREGIAWYAYPLLNAVEALTTCVLRVITVVLPMYCLLQCARVVVSLSSLYCYESDSFDVDVQVWHSCLLLWFFNNSLSHYCTTVLRARSADGLVTFEISFEISPEVSPK